MYRIILALATCASAAIDLRGVELYSNQSVRFGRWEIRMKAAASPGTVSSFFTYQPDSYLDAPNPWREIDIEVLGNKPTSFQSNLITGTASSKNTSESVHAIGSDLSTTYHTYTLDWTPDSVVWRMDGKNVRKTTAPDQQVVDLRDSTETFRMNLWASTSVAWVGKLDTTKLPVLQIVHWMRFSTYTPGAGPGGSNFTSAWIDTFKTLNRSRWAMGNWTFDQNYATFSANNCKVIDGHLVMMLSTTAKEGQFPATFPHDSTSSSSIQDRNATSTTTKGFLSRGMDGIWRAVSASPQLEAFDLGGRKVAVGKLTATGQELDLRAFANALLIIRQGVLSVRLPPGAAGTVSLR